MIKYAEKFEIIGCIADGDIIEKIVPSFKDGEIIELGKKFLEENKKLYSKSCLEDIYDNGERYL